jgi:hypothetical protein
VPLPPVVTATSAIDIAPTMATFNATVKPGFGATVVFFEYGPTLPYTSSTRFTDPTPADNTEHVLSAQVDGLLPGTTYHYRAVAVNFNGVTQGPDRTFSTPELSPVNPGPPGAAMPSGAPLPAPVPPAPEGKKKCRKHFVMRHGRCVRKHRKRHRRRHHPKRRHGGRNG